MSLKETKPASAGLLQGGNKMSKKQKIEIVKIYFGSVFKNVKEAEKYVREQKDDRAYEYMLDFIKGQAIEAFKED